MENKKKALLAGGILGGLFVGANAGKIIRGIGIGLLAIGIAFLLIWNSVNGVKENSKIVANLELQDLSEIETDRGLIKGYGVVSSIDELETSIEGCIGLSSDFFDNEECLFTDSIFEIKDAIYYSIETQRFEVIKETKENEDGSETTSYDQKWITYLEEEKWADVSIGGVEIKIEDAKTILDKESETVEDVYIKDADEINNFDQKPEKNNPEFGTTRALVSYIPNDGREFIVVGEMANDTIRSGEVFIVTDKTDSVLVSHLSGEETAARYGFRFMAFILLTFGLSSMLTPVFIFTDWIPFIGSAARWTATFISALIALIITIISVVLLQLWWLILILAVIGILLMANFSKEAVDTKVPDIK